MNETKYLNILEKLKNNEFQEAYDDFSKLYEKDHKDYVALFYRSIIDFINLSNNLEQTRLDFLELIEQKTPFMNKVKPYFVIICANLGFPYLAIQYGDDALKEAPEFKLDIYFAICRAYLQIDENEASLKALQYIDLCLEEDNEEIRDFYEVKVNILLNLKRFDEADDVLNIMYTKFNASAIYYYLKGRTNLEKAKEIKDNKLLIEEAIRNIEISSQYEEDSLASKMLLVEAYTYSEHKEKALEVLEKVKSSFEDDEYLIEELKIYEAMQEDEKVVTLCEEYLANKFSWRIAYSLAYFLSNNATTDDEIKKVKDLFMKAYLTNQESFILYEIYRINYIQNLDNENVTLLEEQIKKEPENGKLHFMLGEAKQRLDYDYDEIIKSYQASNTHGYIDELFYLTIMLEIVEKPRNFYPFLRPYIKMDINKLSPWMQRKMAIRFMYGEEGCKKDLIKAEAYIKEAIKTQIDEPCILTTYGRLLELRGQNDLAFEVYQNACNLLSKEFRPACSCAYGYLAHAYIKGIGTVVNEEKAKNLIIEGLKNSFHKSNILIYLYTYYALQNDHNFSLEEAFKMLLVDYPFYRYEMSRFMYLLIIAKKLNKDTETIKQIKNKIKQSLINGDKLNRKFYQKNKKLDIFYPDFNNY